MFRRFRRFLKTLHQKSPLSLVQLPMKIGNESRQSIIGNGGLAAKIILNFINPYSVMKPPGGFLDFLKIIDNHMVKLLNILIFKLNINIYLTL